MDLLEQIYGNIEDEPPYEYTEYKTEKGYGWADALPQRQGLYDPELEKDACGVGFAAWVMMLLVPQWETDFSNLFGRHIKGNVSHKIISDGKSLAGFGAAHLIVLY